MYKMCSKWPKCVDTIYEKKLSLTSISSWNYQSLKKSRQFPSGCHARLLRKLEISVNTSGTYNYSELWFKANSEKHIKAGWYSLSTYRSVIRIQIEIFTTHQRPTKLRGGNVFTCVCLFTEGSLYGHYPWCIGPHCTAPPTPIPPRYQIWGPVVLTSGGHHLRPVQTCSFEDTPLLPILTSGGQSGWYASYWNAFLFGNELYHQQSLSSTKLAIKTIWFFMHQSKLDLHRNFIWEISAGKLD